MDKERLPQWGWLLIGLFGMAMVSQLLNATVLGPIGLTEDYHVVTLIAGMSVVVIYISVWYDDDREHYWESSKASIFGDVFFILLGAIVASGFAVTFALDAGLRQLLRELLGMIAGFVTAWGLFYWRNTDLYRVGSD